MMPRSTSLSLDAIGFALMMAAFFGWYIALCPPDGAASPRATHYQVAAQIAEGR